MLRNREIALFAAFCLGVGVLGVTVGFVLSPAATVSRLCTGVIRHTALQSLPHIPPLPANISCPCRKQGNLSDGEKEG